MNIVSKRWKAKENLDLLQRIWLLIKKYELVINFIKVSRNELILLNLNETNSIQILTISKPRITSKNQSVTLS